MKLLTISNLFPNPVMPNRGLFVKERLFQTIQRHGIEADVVSPLPYFPSTHPRFGEYAAFARVPKQTMLDEGQAVKHPTYFMLPKLGSMFSPWSFARAVEGCARRELREADLIDGHFLFPDGVAAALLARRYNKPVVLTARGSDVNFMPDEYWAGKWLRRMFAMRPRLIAVSEALGKKLRELAPQCQVDVVSNGVDLKRFKPSGSKSDLKQRLGIEGPLVISVGNLVALKGHDLAIRATARLPGVQLRVIGQGPEGARLNTLIDELSLSERAALTGAMDQAQLIDYYTAADVLVLASSHEGMPNVLLECLACGTPVVGTADGASEVIAKCQFSRQVQRDVVSITRAVRELLALMPLPASVRSGMAGEDWGKKCQKLYAIYEEMLRNGTPA